MTHHKSRDLFWPFLLIILGFLFLFQNLGYIDAGEIFSDYWPVLLIIWGISIIFKRDIFPKETVPPESKKIGDSSHITLSTDTIAYSKTFGDLHIKVTSKNFQGGKIENTFGEIHLNLQEIELGHGENKLYINGVFGDINITLPTGIAVKVESSITGGSIKIFDDKVEGFSKELIKQSQNYDSATKKLIIFISLTFGDIVVW